MFKIITLASFLLSSPFYLQTSSYNYSYWGDIIHSAPGMTYATYIDSENLGVDFSSPEDLVVFNKQIYVVDSASDSLVVIDEGFDLVVEMTSFQYTQAYIDYLATINITDQTSLVLDAPYGIDVTESGIFICDTGNYRIIKLNHNYEVLNVFSEIDDVTFDEISFEPKKITVDGTDRMYVVARNVYEGIMEINYDGSFNRFTGVNPIQLTPFEIFSRSIMTEEQIAQLQLFLPTEYTNVTIDERNFIYATSKVSENNDNNPIQLINPKGVDVVKRNGYFPPKGDIQYISGMNSYVIDGPSTLVDIAITVDGI
ncbi:MAG: hypothetical protein KJ847_02260, partial [Firmicutes bacterium]|nr:hypothetical protein [Bacillota bacterium]